MQINATKKKLYVPSFRDLIAGKVKKPIVLLSGGRGGAKSTSVAQAFARSAIKRQFARQAIVRKFFKYIRESQYNDIKTYLERIKADSQVTQLVSPLSFRFPDSEIISLGLDAQKVKSLSGVERIWIEEATELTEEDWINLSLTVLRGQGDRQVILTYNPQYSHWINNYFFHEDGTPKRSDTYYLHTTYKDNPFVGQTYIDLIEGLPPELYRMHGLGLPSKLEGLIYPDVTLIREFPDIPYCFGVDKGFNDPFSVVKTGYQDGNLYCQEIAYQRGETPTQMIQRLSEYDKRVGWYFDDSAADTIQEFYAAGFNAQRASKGQIVDGINKVKRCNIFYTEDSSNLRKEQQGYVWGKDKAGKYTDQPALALNDHAMDAKRYGAINCIPDSQLGSSVASAIGKRRS